jgi:hypothetical protein
MGAEADSRELIVSLLPFPTCEDAFRSRSSALPKPDLIFGARVAAEQISTTRHIRPGVCVTGSFKKPQTGSRRG